MKPYEYLEIDVYDRYYIEIVDGLKEPEEIIEILDNSVTYIGNGEVQDCYRPMLSWTTSFQSNIFQIVNRSIFSKVNKSNLVCEYMERGTLIKTLPRTGTIPSQVYDYKTHGTVPLENQLAVGFDLEVIQLSYSQASMISEGFEEDDQPKPVINSIACVKVKLDKKGLWSWTGEEVDAVCFQLTLQDGGRKDDDFTHDLESPAGRIFSKVKSADDVMTDSFNTRIIYCINEREILNKYQEYVADCSIFVAHNGFGYDLPRIKESLERHNIPPLLSYIGCNVGEAKKFKSTKTVVYDPNVKYIPKYVRIKNRLVIDTMLTSMGYGVESVALKDVGNKMFGSSKMDVDYSALTVLQYSNNETKIAKYCIQDALLTLFIALKQSIFILLEGSRGYGIPPNMSFIMGKMQKFWIKMKNEYWESKQIHFGISNIVPKYRFSGGTAYSANPGVYTAGAGMLIASDCKALYPTIIMKFCVSPENIYLSYEEKPSSFFDEFNCKVVSARLYLNTRLVYAYILQRKTPLLECVEKLWSEREEYRELKKTDPINAELHGKMEQMKKLLANASYGIMSLQDSAMGGLVTHLARKIIKFCPSLFLKEYGKPGVNFLYVSTDSMIVHVQDKIENPDELFLRISNHHLMHGVELVIEDTPEKIIIPKDTKPIGKRDRNFYEIEIFPEIVSTDWKPIPRYGRPLLKQKIMVFNNGKISFTGKHSKKNDAGCIATIEESFVKHFFKLENPLNMKEIGDLISETFSNLEPSDIINWIRTDTDTGRARLLEANIQTYSYRIGILRQAGSGPVLERSLPLPSIPDGTKIILDKQHFISKIKSLVAPYIFGDEELEVKLENIPLKKSNEKVLEYCKQMCNSDVLPTACGSHDCKNLVSYKVSKLDLSW